jgi:hypothetical protein
VATAFLIVPTGNSHLCPLGYDYTFAMPIIFALVDSGGDGAMSLEEFQAAHARIFKAIDADKDGTLTLEELQSLRGAGKGTAEQLGSAGPEQPTAPIFGKVLVEVVAVRDAYPPCQRISAQSPPKPDATISRLDPPSPRVGGLLPQALVSGLRHLEVERLACD